MDPEIRDLILRLREKIDALEHKIDCLSLGKQSVVDVARSRSLKGLSPDPPLNFNDWLANITITDDCVLLVITGLLNAFQVATKPLLTSTDVPIYKHNNKLYVFDNTNCWVQWTEENLRIFIREIWRKFIKIHIGMSQLDEELYLAQRKQILEMRSKLYDIKTNRFELNKWIARIV